MNELTDGSNFTGFGKAVRPHPRFCLGVRRPEGKQILTGKLLGKLPSLYCVPNLRCGVLQAITFGHLCSLSKTGKLKPNSKMSRDLRYFMERAKTSLSRNIFIFRARTSYFVVCSSVS